MSITWMYPLEHLMSGVITLAPSMVITWSTLFTCKGHGDIIQSLDHIDHRSSGKEGTLTESLVSLSVSTACPLSSATFLLLTLLPSTWFFSTACSLGMSANRPTAGKQVTMGKCHYSGKQREAGKRNNLQRFPLEASRRHRRWEPTR